MAIFNNMSITTKGQILYAKAQAGTELKFTKMMVGSGQIENRNPATLLALLEPKFSIGIQSITPNTELKTATISGTITNSEVSEAVYICEIGLFAEDPDEGEILYAYGSAGKYGDYYAPSSQGAYSWNYQINAAIGNASNVTVELSNLAYDYAVINSNTTFLVISGGNQKEINKSIDKKLSEITTQQNALTNDSYPIVEATGTNAYIGSSARIRTVGKGTRCTLFISTPATDNCSLNLNDSGAVAIKDSNGNIVTNLKANIPYNLCHNGSDFILQGKGGGGNLIAKYLLSGYYGEGDNGRVDGAMVNRGAPTAALNCGGTYNLQEGYYSGGKVTANSLASHLSSDTLTLANQLLKGIKAHTKNGVQVTGTLELSMLTLIKTGSAIVAGAGSSLGSFTGGIKVIFTYEVATSNNYVSFFNPSAGNGTLPLRLVKTSADMFNTSETTTIHKYVYWYWYNNNLAINRGSQSSYDGKEFKYKIFDIGYTLSDIMSF